jgi:hypothetical protein
MVMLQYLIEEGRRALHELSIGHTFENEKWRVHRYAGSVVVTDLANAGKRGKKCREIVVYDIDWKRLPVSADSIAKTFVDLAKRNKSVKDMEKAAQEFKDVGANMSVRDQRGIDVKPGGFETLTIHGDNVFIEAEYDSFRVKNLQDKFNEPTCIPAIKGGKKSIPQFYRWVKDNQSKIKKMTFSEVLKGMDREGIKYHQFCAMD